MRPIPPKLREALANDPFMKRCVFCGSHPEYEHAFIYAGRQINEHWAIIPCCEYHHRRSGLNKHMNEYVALLRAFGNPEWEKNMKTKYSRFNWDLHFRWLRGKFGAFDIYTFTKSA